MKAKTKTFLLTALIATTALTVSVQARPGRGMAINGGPMHHRDGMAQSGPAHCDGRLDMIGRVLDLTEEQQQQIDAILQQKEQDREDHRQQMQENRDTMRRLMKQEEFDENAAKVLATEMAQQRADQMVDRLRTGNRIYNLLTDEQKELFQKIEPLMGPMMGRGEHHGPGRLAHRGDCRQEEGDQ